jgi:simple sugar transport system substrate-binding protein
MIYIDKVNPADRPGITVPQLVDELVEKGCRLVIANSDDMKDGVTEAAREHPDVYFVHVSGDQVWSGTAPANLSNLMGRMEYGKMMAGLVAGLTTETGKIGYLGPLINDETRRLAASCYLGAKYAWENLRGKPAADLTFRVNWIGFWFNIPGVTADPTQVAQSFFTSGCDVVVSGIDTTEAVVVAQQQRKAGKPVWAIPYDYRGACEGAAESCLGVPFFNWVPGYNRLLTSARNGSWTSQALWLGPDWSQLNGLQTSTVGFEPGPAMADAIRRQLDRFVAGLAAEKVDLFRGPLSYQDGSVFLAAGKKASDRDVWYMKQLLQGMEGQSSAK